MSSTSKKLYPGVVEKTISGELTLQKFKYGYDIASRTSIINHIIGLFN